MRLRVCKGAAFIHGNLLSFYFSFLQKRAKALFRGGRLAFLQKLCKTLCRGETMHFFLDLQEKSSKKEGSDACVRSQSCRLIAAPINCPARIFRLPCIRWKDRFRLYPEERRFEIWQPRRFCQFDWRVGAYPSLSRRHGLANRNPTIVCDIQIFV